MNILVAPQDEAAPALLDMVINWLPMLLLIGVWVFFLRQMRAGQAQAVPVPNVNWRRGLLRSWIVISLAWLVYWGSNAWYACQTDLCWLGPFSLPHLPPYVPLDSMTRWTWTILAGEGLVVPIALFVLGRGVLWAMEGFKTAE